MSFIGILGSKTGVCGQLIEMMSPEAFGACYIELFFGGGGVFPATEHGGANDLRSRCHECGRGGGFPDEFSAGKRSFCVLHEQSDAFRVSVALP